ncbi:MAG TPA: acyltransferase [Deltaproteobacteria bacterium]|nr:acyltransferase [Deltaproteobacteria bacterium]HOI07340.1 acyltransferase [Deltaproteobacteria bacterium]
MIRSIQSLRAVAALCVVLLTSGGWFAHEYPGAYANPFAYGNGGVDLFFIISGFIMLHSIHAAPAMGARLFMARRIVRIVPLYWVATTFFLALALLFPSMFRQYVFEPWHALRSYLFVPQDSLPVIRTGWTLVYEMYFYVLLTAFLAAGLRARLYWVAAFLSASSLVGLIWPEYLVYPVFNLLASELLLEFVMGMLLFSAFRRGFRVGVPAAAGLVAAGMFLFPVLDGSTRLLSLGIPMALIFSGVVLCRREMLNFRALHVLGDASYSLYLIQVLAVPACGKVVRMLPIDTYALAIPLTAFYLAAAVAAALVLHFTLERPLTDFLKERLRKGRAATFSPSHENNVPSPLVREGQGEG